ncbi:hypothetical protein A2962_04700 [Candidatus Woesebacteria bacterium RIFCSPLOWO2_01_FULL_39_61]|uniref:Carrier domain-containing protein n=1 Tax=Candidatus Woesebacteria bacterium RIFCSPHIGHO2_02_FULL_39_13 TaxID=1802505 RepID=A0A1F7Z5A2_9BACT|nr:MAG: hypothetical protein A2692_01020 [Candidatus Woesebacteria bacterium RIFCSPHIGHO2_01_FULL_39_95]OGM34299.1 MAG: hypothetical protein A3D01_00825 [Candidatus Woesebacteria bacterium RIFCSPHIGHO2_02_FULL_39_13]OGM39081.1 MAG: hypothetical protein A3E13_01550 [Candidatus Woesebacteria bacterium RIFCSPHIGHO2_12_FULL_40_20]OGM68636.1 MAG: hypothetical protein A2962_04700 [Candidatus Woesebacteria bacterium RIFCSPLOWO2_01_FULL_39_61]OGM73986.1 MAG: hypothetical protein A3H19_00660 [Candidatus
MTKNPHKDVKTQIKKLLSEYLGVEPDDIDEEDSLVADLHMKPTDLTDFVEILDTRGLDISKLELTEIETVGELIEEVGLNDYLD